MNGTFLVCFTLLITSSAQTPSQISLKDAIRIARLNSPVLSAARTDADGAKAGARAARAMQLPQISANGFATSGNNASVISSSPNVMPPEWMLIPTGNFVDGNLSLMIPVLSSRLQAMAGSASWQSQAAAGDLSEAEAELSLQVSEAYDRVLLAKEMVLAEQSKVAAATELVRTAQAMFDAGKGIEATVQRSQAELSAGQRALTSTKNEEAKALLDLEAAMGVDMSTPLELSDPLTVAPLTSSLSNYIAIAKKKRGMVQAARARAASAGADIGAAKSQNSPQVYGVVMSDATNRSDMGGVSVGLTVSLPLFDGGRIRAEVSQAKSMRSKAEANLKLAEITSEKEVRQAWLDVQSAQANKTSASSAVTAAKASYDVVVLRVSAGKSILIEQLDALEALVRAQSDLAQATFDEALAVAKLNRAIGGQL
jgi:outer membrane protein